MARAKSGFRVDTTQLRRRLAKLGEEIRADEFKPELMQFTQTSLRTAARTTPVRDYALIKRNQAKQYRNRINYIPSVHTLENPTLIVNEKGEHWVFKDSRWYNMGRRVPDDVWTAYQNLMAERNRRMQTARAPFIASRAQARFLHRKSWNQVGESLGLSMPKPAGVSNAESRHNPKKDPPRGYGTIQGGKVVLAVVIRNPFLEQESRYKPFTGGEILGAAMARHEPQFKRRFSYKLKKRMEGIFKQ